MLTLLVFLPLQDSRSWLGSVPLGPLFNPAYAVSRVIVHEQYNGQTCQNYVALMKLFEPLDTTGTKTHSSLQKYNF